jgi:ADP-ribose pyrophosphatase YjhB (NUDIX family)
VAAVVIDGRPRIVCPACGTTFYENPLPVAAAIVLNDARQVLLVKRRRPPHQGSWCLPMGFAELGETIAAAARRELREETGIDGSVMRLLDADSFESTHYGDLLIVTFEVQKTGGHEQPGDDAEEVRYFPVAGHPPLAFSANEKALRACVAAHQEEWAIQASFVALHSGENAALLSDVLVTLIAQRAEEVAGLWLADVRSNPSTASYHALDPGQLLDRATVAISQFGRWLKGDEAAGEVKAFYQALAEERQRQGCRTHEVLSSLTLLKKHLWTFAWSQGVWQRPVDVYRVLELSRRMAVFFDQALYRVARAFDADRQG